MIRENFNQSWELRHDLSTIMESVVPSTVGIETVQLPHDEMIRRPRYASCPTGSYQAYFEGEDFQYIKRFSTPLSERDKVHYLSFDGVFTNAAIYLNNRFVTRHANGYTPFLIRLDDYLKYDAENELKVQIRGAAQPNSRWYSGLGIYRDVHYMVANLLHIAHDSLHVTTLFCDEELACLRIEAQIINAGTYGRQAHLEYDITDDHNRSVRSGHVKFYIRANDQISVATQVELAQPALWSAEHPALYHISVRIVEENEEIDRAESTFGVRTIQVDSVHGLRINGETVKLRGGAVHHDNGVIGSISVPDAEMRRVKLLKSAGYNAIRTAHNPPSAALLDACDRVGMYVMHEYTDVWTDAKATYDFGVYFDEAWEDDVTNLVNRDYNHPSIVLWSIGNEIPEAGDGVSLRYGRLLVQKYHSLDATRPVTNALNMFTGVQTKVGEIMADMGILSAEGGLNDMMNYTETKRDEQEQEDQEFEMPQFMMLFASNRKAQELMEESADILDVVGYNYTADFYEPQHVLYPNRLFLGTETHPSVLDHNWRIVESLPYVIGDFAWTAWDYLGEVGAGRLLPKAESNGVFMGTYPWISAYTGDFNLIGDRRPISYWRDTIWTGRDHKPTIEVRNPSNYAVPFATNYYAWTDSMPCWSWNGLEGTTTGVEVYSDAQEVELFVNGVSQGRQPVGTAKHEFYTLFEVPYTPGTLEAVAYIDGEEVGREQLSTVGESALVVTMDNSRLRAGTDDLAYVLIELRDADGTLDYLSTRKVTIETEGVELVGMGSGDPQTEECYQDATHQFYEGKCLAVVRAGRDSGTGRITISVPGLSSITREIEVIS